MSRILTVYVMEMRGLFRDRNVLIYTLALPAFLYPVILAGTLQAVAYTRGIEERRPSRLLVDGPAADDLRRFIEERRAELEEGEPAEIELLAGGERTEDGGLRALVEGPRPPVDAAAFVASRGSFDGLSIGPLEVDLYYSEARDASLLARSRLEDVLEDWRKARLAAAAREIGESEDLLRTVRVEPRSVSTAEEVAGHVAGRVLPVVMILMTALGALYPALETTVGEKERGTLETTLVAPVERSALVGGKYLAVASAAFVSFALNLAGMTLTFLHLQAQLPVGGFRIGLGALALIALAAVLLAAFLSALMMPLAFIARSFKEGQTYVTPVYLLAVVPSLVALDPEAHLTPALAALPLVNSSLLFRDALSGTADPASTAIVFASSLAYAGMALWGASRLLAREEVATGGAVPLGRALSWAIRRRRGKESS